MKKILVTGGFGFVGTHLIEILLNEGNYVHVIDNLSSNPLPLEYSLKLINNDKLTYDIIDLIDFEPKGKYDEIYHLASVVGPAGVLKYGGTISKSICDDTYHIIQIARKTGAKLLHVSTSEIYGGGRDGYCKEDMAKIIQ